MKTRTCLPFAAVLLVLAAAPAQSGLSDLANATSQLTTQPSAQVEVPADVVSGLQGLASSFNLSQFNLASLAKDALSALKGGEDGKALAALDKLGAAGLTPGQLAAFKTAKTAVDAYVLKRNFAEIPEVKSLVADSLMLIKSGDFAGVVGKLQSMATSVKPSPGQKAILDPLLAQYRGWAAAQ